MCPPVSVCVFLCLFVRGVVDARRKEWVLLQVLCLLWRSWVCLVFSSNPGCPPPFFLFLLFLLADVQVAPQCGEGILVSGYLQHVTRGGLQSVTSSYHQYISLGFEKVVRSHGCQLEGTTMDMK